MLFNSVEFLFFLPIVFLLYWFVFKSLKWQNLFIVLVSYIFYGWWNKNFLILIAFTTLCSYLSGILLDRISEKGGKARAIAAINIVINLLILGVYKYYNFFADSLIEAFSGIGVELHMKSLNLVLPVGISFYTFQSLSYTIDVYKGKLKPTRDIISFFAFISFFPQLVAGPIERATNLLPQFAKPRIFDYNQAVDGCKQMLWGFFKKMVIADNCAVIVNSVWNDYVAYDAITLLYVAILFTFQIYGDFSGYSDIAIGTGRLFGINLMRNFNFPYFSRDIAEFWRRWHISLTTWFRDYIYIPLGGSRCTRWKVMRNTLIIFLVSGLWHGANWTFVVWGIYHALLFFPLMLLGMNRKYVDVVGKGRLLPSIKELIQMIFTFLLVVIGWIIFRAENITQAWNYILRIFTESSLTMPMVSKRVVPLIFILIFIEWFQRDKQHALQFTDNGIFTYSVVRYVFYIVLAVLILLLAAPQATFIYFQF